MMGNVVARVLKRKHNVWDKEGGPHVIISPKFS